MKWYTLDERPVKSGDQGLFFLGDARYRKFIFGFVTDDHEIFIDDELVIDDFNSCCSDKSQLTEVIYWIPEKELKATLPNKL